MSHGKDTQVKIFYIASSERSGSTLLGMVLGTREGYFFAGELENLWSKGLIENRLCACGIPVRECPFWAEVLDRAFGGVASIDAREIEELRWAEVKKGSLIRQKVMGSMNASRREPSRYRALMGSLVRAAQEVSGKKYLIDSSGSTSQAYFLLSDPNVEMEAIHLVRDPRGVAYSKLKRKLHQPESGNSQYWMTTAQPGRTAMAWIVRNSGLEWILRGRIHARARYEDWVRDPLGEMADWFPGVQSLDQSNGTWTFHPGENHSVSGNPTRFQREPIKLRLDAAWMQGLSDRHKWAVTGLTLPYLLRYGYPVDWRTVV
jgi:hypothetical protein